MTVVPDQDVVMDDEPTSAPTPTEAPVAANDANQVVFDVEDLSVYYGDFRAVRDVKLKVRRNEITAFIGPSGCGKTTVARLLPRFYDVDSGAVSIDGDSMRYSETTGLEIYCRHFDHTDENELKRAQP